MYFWDHFIRRLYATFSNIGEGHLHRSLRAAQRILNVALDQKLFLVEDLDPQTLAILDELNSPVAEPFARAEQERRDAEGQPIAALPSVARAPEPFPLLLFLTRLYLDDSPPRGENEALLHAWATMAFEHSSSPGTNMYGSFCCYLYCCLLAPPSGLPTWPKPDSPMPPTPIPQEMPAVAPSMCGAEERQFLVACFGLWPWPGRVCLYLSLYAQLDLQDIKRIRERLEHRTVNWQVVMEDLEAYYTYVLQHYEPPMG